MQNRSTNVAQRGFTLGSEDFDLDPSYWEGCIGKRFIAYIIDVVVLGFVWMGLGFVALLTLGLALPLTTLLWALAPLAYHTLMVSQRGATVGQQFMGLRIVDARSGGKPSFMQAVILTIAFYLSVIFWFVPLAYVIFDDRDRFLHDIISNTRSLRADRLREGVIA